MDEVEVGVIADEELLEGFLAVRIGEDDDVDVLEGWEIGVIGRGLKVRRRCSRLGCA